MSKRRPREGICKLTQAQGNFVDSHILPKALTRAEGLAPGLTQYGQGQMERRSSSWYDPALVTKQGEKILSAYDNWAIATLRDNKMVWSGWGQMQSLDDHVPIPGTHFGLREINFEDGDVTKRLRLFLLSLLWRAAATERWEFAEVNLSSGQLEMLRLMVLNGDQEPLEFFPISLLQHSTLGLRHNMTPIACIKHIPAIGENSGWEEPIFRFFLDGLVIHYSRLSIEEAIKKDLGPLRVGGANSLTISTVRYEDSAEAQNLSIVLMEANLGRPLFEIPHGPFSPKRNPFE